MTVPARASKLDPYGEEILALHRQGRKLAEISKHLAQTYGLSVALSTLSEYVNRPRPSASIPAAAPPVTSTPAQEMLLDQVEVYAEIQASVRVLVEEMQAMRSAFPDIARIEQRLEALARQSTNATSRPAAMAELPDDLKTLLPALQRFLESQRATAPPSGAAVPTSVLRRIWVRAFWATTVLWLIVVLVACYLLDFWQAPLR